MTMKQVLFVWDDEDMDFDIEAATAAGVKQREPRQDDGSGIDWDQVERDHPNGRVTVEEAVKLLHTFAHSMGLDPITIESAFRADLAAGKFKSYREE